jgi:hypothetical protein
LKRNSFITRVAHPITFKLKEILKKGALTVIQRVVHLTSRVGKRTAELQTPFLKTSLIPSSLAAMLGDTANLKLSARN